MTPLVVEHSRTHNDHQFAAIVFCYWRHIFVFSYFIEQTKLPKIGENVLSSSFITPPLPGPCTPLHYRYSYLKMLCVLMLQCSVDASKWKKASLLQMFLILVSHLRLLIQYREKLAKHVFVFVSFASLLPTHWQNSSTAADCAWETRIHMWRCWFENHILSCESGGKQHKSRF